MGTDGGLHRDIAISPARGCAIGLLLGALMWALLSLAVMETFNAATEEERTTAPNTGQDSRDTSDTNAEIRILLTDSSGVSNGYRAATSGTHDDGLGEGDGQQVAVRVHAGCE